LGATAVFGPKRSGSASGSPTKSSSGGARKSSGPAVDRPERVEKGSARKAGDGSSKSKARARANKGTSKDKGGKEAGKGKGKGRTTGIGTGTGVGKSKGKGKGKGKEKTRTIGNVMPPDHPTREVAAAAAASAAVAALNNDKQQPERVAKVGMSFHTQTCFVLSGILCGDFGTALILSSPHFSCIQNMLLEAIWSIVKGSRKCKQQHLMVSCSGLNLTWWL
jgi:hypothetical protein